MSSIPLCSSVMIAWILAVPAPIDKVVLEQIELLAPDHSKEQRLGAMVKLEKLATEKNKVVGLSSAITALADCLEDKDSKIRKQALTALKVLATESQKECPIAVVKALFDTDSEVRSTAIDVVNSFSKFPKEAIPLFILGLTDSKREIKDCACQQLRTMMSENPKNKEIIKDLKGEEHLRKLLKQAKHSDRFEPEKTLGALIYSPVAVADVIKRLGSDQSKDERLTTLSDLRCMHRSHKGALDFAAAMPVLTKCSSSQEKDMEVRDEAIMLLFGLAYQLKQPCPMVFVEALSEKNVPINALNAMGMFDAYPKEAIPFLLRALEHPNPDRRHAAVMPLAYCGVKSKEVLGAIEKATKDSDESTRDQAELVLWKLTKNWDRYVKHLLQRVEDLSRSMTKPKEETSEAKSKRELKFNLAMFCVWQLHKLEADKPEELIPVLIKLLADPSPVIRKCAARSLGAAALASPKAKETVKKSDAKSALTKLLDDRDEAVRLDAEEAIKRIDE